MVAMIKQYLIALLLILLSLAAAAADRSASAIDWSDVGQTAREHHSPILVLFSAESCSYCIRLKKEIITPLSEEESADHHLLIQEFDINAGGKVIDFDGDPIRSRKFKKRYGIFATPTLLILDSEGRLLTEPIVGYNSASEYKELLNASLVTSYRELE
jgi:thioredoxin-related protein